MSKTLIYIHDPMCSWCYGFGPALAALHAGLPSDLGYRRLLGGLAADCAEAMPEAMRLQIQETWRRIERRIPGICFNFDFWTRCTPRRSTYPACRAVIAARAQDPTLDEAMTTAIQRAYYQEARNPSERETLIALAGEIGADQVAFAAALDAPATLVTLGQELALTQALRVSGFPSLVLDGDGSRWPIPVDYTDPGAMLAAIAQLC
jgi:putative protein-disulfide isomerase